MNHTPSWETEDSRSWRGEEWAGGELEQRYRVGDVATAGGVRGGQWGVDVRGESGGTERGASEVAVHVGEVARLDPLERQLEQAGVD